MAVTPGHTGSEAQVPATRAGAGASQVAVPGQLPESTAEITAEAASLLGWHADVLPETTLLGRKVHICATLRADAHAERIATGTDPVTDRAAVATWCWPELAHTAPTEAADVRGVLAVTKHWRTGLAWVVPFARYVNAAMVLPASATMTHDYVTNCLPRARTFGIAVLTVDDDGVVRRDLAADPERVMLADDALSRWVNELVYAQLLETAPEPTAAH